MVPGKKANPVVVDRWAALRAGDVGKNQPVFAGRGGAGGRRWKAYYLVYVALLELVDRAVFGVNIEFGRGRE